MSENFAASACVEGRVWHVPCSCHGSCPASFFSSLCVRVERSLGSCCLLATGTHWANGNTHERMPLSRPGSAVVRPGSAGQALGLRSAWSANVPAAQRAQAIAGFDGTEDEFDDDFAAAEEFTPPKQRSPARPSSAQQQAAYRAADAASAATAAVCDTSAVQLAAKLTAAGASEVDRLGATHRLNELFAACATYEAAVALAAELCAQPHIGAILVELLSEGGNLVEVVVQLMSSLCLHDDGVKLIDRSGALPVLVAAMRAYEPLLRAHGLSLLALLAERADMARPLVRAGSVRLLTFLAMKSIGALMEEHGAAAATAQSSQHEKASERQQQQQPALGSALLAEEKSRAAHMRPLLWPLLLEVAEGVLVPAKAVPPPQRKPLFEALSRAQQAHNAGYLPLEPTDANRLKRLLKHLHVLALAVTTSATTSSSSSGGGSGGMGGGGAGGTGGAVASASYRVERPSLRKF